ncbi:heme ABC exporter ATP-binding protein CcmA [uncultured Sphingomonas sp.]|uniref:heme ABC exporter ATP-binding protein CcmA n=1 Tax=uncultured Sphingomonas sp. TaxID=158754 RepID=UPI0035CBEB19
MLRFDNVACIRGGRRLFEGLSFKLEPGGAALVSGPNGVGKSSLIRVAAGLLPPAAGRVAASGARALLTEATALDDDLSLADALLFWARLDRSDVAAAVDGALTALALGELAEMPVRLLSTGQRRRAAFARVLASGMPIWLLDEPANGLDAEAVERLATAMAGHRAAGGIVLVASHLPIGLPAARQIALGK